MKTIERSALYAASPFTVFPLLDDLGVTGTHMTKSSWMMMGSKLNLEFLTPNRTGPQTKYRWSGKMMGMTIDFTVAVTKWVNGEEKIWETIGEPKLIIYSWYRMELKVNSGPNWTMARLSISYEKPKGIFYQVLYFLFSGWYARWCLRKMLGDAKKMLENNQHDRGKELEAVSAGKLN